MFRWSRMSDTIARRHGLILLMVTAYAPLGSTQDGASFTSFTVSSARRDTRGEPHARIDRGLAAIGGRSGRQEVLLGLMRSAAQDARLVDSTCRACRGRVIADFSGRSRGRLAVAV